VGQPGAALRFPRRRRRRRWGRLWGTRCRRSEDLAPANPCAGAYSVPTCSIGRGRNDIARGAGSGATGRRDFLRGRSVLSLFSAVKTPRIPRYPHLEGRAARRRRRRLASGFEPVFIPRQLAAPLGSVPRTDARFRVYQRPAFLRARAIALRRPPPVFVLDRNRLARYVDEDGKFDKPLRGQAPTAENLHPGIRHLFVRDPVPGELRGARRSQ